MSRRINPYETGRRQLVAWKTRKDRPESSGKTDRAAMRSETEESVCEVRGTGFYSRRW